MIEEELEKQGSFAFSEEQRELYKTTGGAPHLDGAYTAFGEVYEGLDVLDSIAVTATDESDRPKEDIIIEMEMIN